MDSDSSAARSAPRKRRLFGKTLGCRVLVALLSSYFSVGAAAAIFQHRLVYKPIQKEPIEPEDSRLEHMAVSTIQVPTHDGLMLNGWRATPIDRSPRCAVLFFHGNFGNRTWCWRTLKMFEELNVEVWLIDYRGYGDNSGTPNEEDFQEDARSTWSLLTETHGIPSDEIVICGYSLGGAVAVGLASELCETGIEPRGLITVATFPSLADAAAERFPLLPVRLMLNEQWPSARQMKLVTCPILHVHGTHDRIVPMGLGRKLFAAAPAHSTNDIPKQFLELPNCDHLSVFRDGRQACGLKIDEFLDQIPDLQDGDSGRDVIMTSALSR